jgi:DNA-binding CsgD family transcriptional regulator
MPVPRANDRRLWQLRLAELTSFTDSVPFDAASLADAAADLLARFTGAGATVYRPVRQESGFGIRFWGRRGLDEAFVTDFRALLAAPPAEDGLFLFDPTRPDPAERNVLRVIEPTENAAGASSASQVFGKHGMGAMTQTRMLVCNGPVLLSWIGVFRERVRTRENGGGRSAREAKRDASLVESLGRALRRPLRLLHGLPADGQGLFEALLETLAGDAYLVTGSGRVETANTRGAAHLASGLREEKAELQRAILEHLAGHEPAAFEVHPLRIGHELYILHRRPRAASAGIAQRLDEARTRWRLSAQQVAVLRELGEGAANKVIAERLSISVRTVEKHVTDLAAKAGVDSRLRLVAELWKPREP